MNTLSSKCPWHPADGHRAIVADHLCTQTMGQRSRTASGLTLPGMIELNPARSRAATARPTPSAGRIPESGCRWRSWSAQPPAVLMRAVRRTPCPNPCAASCLELVRCGLELGAGNVADRWRSCSRRPVRRSQSARSIRCRPRCRPIASLLQVSVQSSAQDALDRAARDLRGIAAEFLPQRHRRRILRVRAADLDDVRPTPSALAASAASRCCRARGAKVVLGALSTAATWMRGWDSCRWTTGSY